MVANNHPNSGLRPVIGQITHPGLMRAANEDAFGWFSVPAGELLVVADGIGGNAGGAEAAQATVAAFHKYVKIASEEPGTLLRQAVRAADQAVSQIGLINPELAGLGSTIVALLIQAGEAFYIHVGDSRLYHLSSGRLLQLTRDHTYVRDLVEAGQITETEAASHEDRNIITQSLGGNVNEVRLTVGRATYRPGDIFLLCTDGLWGPAPEAAIWKTLTGAGSPQVLAKKLIALALNAGGPDNVTVQLAAFPSRTSRTTQALPRSGAGERPRRRLLAVVFILGLLGGAVGAYAWPHWSAWFSQPIEEAPAPADPAPAETPPESPAESSDPIPVTPPQRPGEL
ncbi:hypothetical protein FACS189460_4830 [Deltaproteobacteria bacterium]|nr:hypothetical protein FACS189460_4830 [Deltaproteobacteria bacterium]